LAKKNDQIDGHVTVKTNTDTLCAMTQFIYKWCQYDSLTLAVTHHCGAVVSTSTAFAVSAFSMARTWQAHSRLPITQLSAVGVDTVTMALTRSAWVARLHRVAIVTSRTANSHKQHYIQDSTKKVQHTCI